MTFPDFWKIVSAGLAGVFAILSIIWDIRDKSTGKITVLGRVFLLLTILSAGASMLAQGVSIRESQKELLNDQDKNGKLQQSILDVLKEVKYTVRQVDRSVSLLNRPIISFALTLNCGTTLSEDCRSIRGSDLRSIASFPRFKNALPTIGFYIYSKSTIGDPPREPECPLCSDSADLYFSLWLGKELNSPVIMEAPLSNVARRKRQISDKDCKKTTLFPDSCDSAITKGPYMTFTYDDNTVEDSESLGYHARSIVSIADLAGSTVILNDSHLNFNLLDFITPISVEIQTSQGQSARAENFHPSIIDGKKVFIGSFPDRSE